MARIRTIKPDFFTSLTIADLPLTARLTFIGLWTHVDDDGRAVDDPRLIKAAVWPLDDRTSAEVEQDLAALHRLGLILRYEVGGRRYLAVRSWKEHQRIDKPSKSRLPAPTDGAPSGPGGGIPGGLPEGSSSESDGDQPRPGNSEESGESDTGRVDHPKSATHPVDNSETAPLTCTDTRSRKSPGSLPEGSRPERKGTGNREQGKEGEKTSVLAVGELTDRNARAKATAPSAQPKISFAARSLITGIPRYRVAPTWVRRRLFAMAQVALNADFRPDAIARYAAMVIAETRFAEHQHIPEFRDALRRLNRDATLATTCRSCGSDPTACPCTATSQPAPERPWTEADQAALERDMERVLAHLGVTPDDLAQEA